jgi:hypothetical protein
MSVFVTVSKKKNENQRGMEAHRPHGTRAGLKRENSQSWVVILTTSKEYHGYKMEVITSHCFRLHAISNCDWLQCTSNTLSTAISNRPTYCSVRTDASKLQTLVCVTRSMVVTLLWATQLAHLHSWHLKLSPTVNTVARWVAKSEKLLNWQHNPLKLCFSNVGL